MTIRAGTDKKWRQIAVFIARYKQAHGGEAPSIRAITDQMGFSSTSVTHHYLNGAAQAGLIILPDHYHHGIRLPGEQYLPPDGLVK